MPFAWGRRGNDCVSFTAGAVLALTGEDPLMNLDWRSAAQAARLLKRWGGMEAAVSSRLQSIPLAHAHRGDVAAVAHAEHGLMLMVVEGATLVGPGESGLCRAPRERMLRAWSTEG